MDGLLVDTEPLWFEVESAVMAWLGGEWTHADQHALVGGSLHRSVDYLLERAGRPASVSHQEVADALIGRIVELLAVRQITPLPGVMELLGELAEEDIPCALVTSSERIVMDAVLAQLAGRGVEFTVTVCAADVREPKPAPEPYLLAAARLGVDPACCAALEDSSNGARAALAAGCVTIAVPSVTTVPDLPGLTVARSLADVDLELIRKLACSVR